MKKRLILVILILMLAVILTACGGAPKIDWELKVSGAVSNPTLFTYEELSAQPQTDLDEVFMDKSVGEDEYGGWSGVLISDIFEKSGVDDNFVSVTAIAADGYAIEISKDELAGGLVALKENEEWIQEADPEHGPIRLVCPETPANRWVFQLIELQIND